MIPFIDQVQYVNPIITGSVDHIFVSLTNFLLSFPF